MAEVVAQNPIYPQLEPFQQFKKITNIVHKANEKMHCKPDGMIFASSKSPPQPQVPEAIPAGLTVISQDKDPHPPPPHQPKNAAPPRVKTPSKPKSTQTNTSIENQTTHSHNRDSIFNRFIPNHRHRYTTREQINNITTPATATAPQYFINALDFPDSGVLLHMEYAALHQKVVNAVVDPKTGL